LREIETSQDHVVPSVNGEGGLERADVQWQARRAAPIIAVFVVLLVAAFVRLSGIDFGRPFAYHPDEWAVLRPAMDMVRQRDWAPHVYWYPSGLIDLQALVVVVARALGGGTLETGQGWLMPWEFLPTQFRYLLAGRLLVATMGVTTVAMVFLIARRLAGAGAGLAAAAFLATMPLHVENSRFLTTDVPVALACTLTLAMTLVASRRQSLRWWLIAGALAGIAGGIKWNGLAVIIVPLAGYLLGASSPRDACTRRRLVPLVLIGASAVVALLLTTPAIVFDAAAVADYLRLQVTGYALTQFNRPQNGLMANLDALIDGLGPVGLAAASIGILAMGFLSRRRVELLVPLFIGCYFVVASLPVLHYARNLLPILPFLAIAAGVVAARISSWLAMNLWRQGTGGQGSPISGSRLWLATAPMVVVLGFVVAVGLSASMAQASRLAVADTRTIARAWMLEHLGRNTHVAREIYTPQFQPDEFLYRGHEFLMRRDWEWYRSTQTDVMVASSGAYNRFVGNPDTPAQDRFYRELFALPELFRVEPGVDRSGPTIRIFALSESARRGLVP
jgi:hypothetical protein